ncbi:peroxisomal carnitine O-octanoyltransferase [Eupeodes corollae]|uniref:peroxisomal carnitine O-octanoyltransferase n=1 Tax=Eupeodes corollae TaxID=290404 RepID=UPI00248F7C59|nr:peroxisomal carnitine O-octanoyltransferase [Eupeodes corollae]XP_055906501.1 peroxisomal carnitine O-octanoyltransferase [Eupeodes corollae]XP_055906502.1 peroxisomal carnitine O-octanoyltransferase [Eupeodes corollae]XP_055906503.1 peroxisomal carnitine O-octanoyltransferase [Eupeodes corollae]XP_055906504.1 peroxisomal carnitine O-octanoyltransferase [Eupeodes corollae]XP_055906505.1 peroxisomal carnitine O-octanoyltransferase [Eupeodes corollae]
MDRESIYISNNEEPSTFEYDESLPALPLPNLTSTLLRYYETLKPFGTAEELSKTRKIIDEFNQGIGAHLQKKLKERASKMKNWLDVWWDAYAYHTLRFPLHPYVSMSMTLKLDCIGIDETPTNCLKTLARITYYTIEYWELLRTERMKPASSGGGKVKYSSALFRRFLATSRIPGETVDKIERHFRSIGESEKPPTHGLIMGKGRIFSFDCFNEDGSIVSPQELLVMLNQVSGILEFEGKGDCVPVLTNDERSSWAKNRQRLLEISPRNKDYLKLVESSIVVSVLDYHEPNNHEEVAQAALNGDFLSKWSDRSSICIAYKSGRFALVGEHSAYDGTLSIHFAFFIQLSLMEGAEPDWNAKPKELSKPIKEIKFDLDEALRDEIERVISDCDARRTDVIITDFTFNDFGKDLIKTLKLHPDSFIQIVIQWTYYLLHGELAPIYETALMRQYYNGRTETLRSCTMEVVNFIKLATQPNSTKASIAESFRKAVNHHTHMMNEAREGKGIDRHLFGLWCVAQEEGLEVPSLYTDPLYAKSGGGGNFVLSTSTLGYTINNGYVAPMVMDGYGVFYSIVSDAIHLYTTVFRGSEKTSAHRFNKKFGEVMLMAKELLQGSPSSSPPAKL